jgi:hypothetical protein
MPEMVEQYPFINHDTQPSLFLSRAYWAESKCGNLLATFHRASLRINALHHYLRYRQFLPSYDANDDLGCDELEHFLEQCQVIFALWTGSRAPYSDVVPTAIPFQSLSN